MPPPDREMRALRTTAGVTRLQNACALRVGGPGALDLLDAVTTSRLFIRENQMLHTLLLDEAARPLADAFVCQDEDSLLLVTDGLSTQALLAHLAAARATLPPLKVEISDLLAEREAWSLDGPYSWELAAALLGPEVLGAPYLSFLHLRGVTCLRAGKTGEYGYLLLVPSAQARELWQRLLTLGAPLDLAEASEAALDQCALENWHYSPRLLPPGSPLTPLELQLQWRVAYDKEFVGAAALQARRAAPLGRVTCFVAGAAVPAGAEVRLGEQEAGTVLVCSFSCVRGDWVGWALLQTKLAWPGLSLEAAGVPLQTRSPPLLNNRSLYIDPHRHSHQTRQNDFFPPLVLS